MNAKFRAFVETEVIGKEKSENNKTRLAKVIENWNEQDEFSPFYEYVSIDCLENIVLPNLDSLKKQWLPKQLYLSFKKMLEETIGFPINLEYFLNFKNQRYQGCVLWDNENKKYLLKLFLEPDQARKKAVALNAHDLFVLGHEFAHFVIWMGNGEPNIPQILEFDCLRRFTIIPKDVPSRIFYQHSSPYEEERNQLESVCDKVGIIFLEKALSRTDPFKPFPSSFLFPL